MVSLNQLKQLVIHPVTLSALAGTMLGVIYLSFNPLDDAEWQNPPTHAAQLAEVNWDASLASNAKLKTVASMPIMGVAQEGIPLAEQLPELAIEAIAPITEINSHAQGKKPLKAFSTEEQYLLSTNSQYYTLQLMGGRDQTHAHDFIKDNEIADKAYVYRKQVDGDHWYVVLLGEYPTKEEAQEAAKKLPQTLSEQKPRIRSMQSVQQEIQSDSR